MTQHTKGPWTVDTAWSQCVGPSYVIAEQSVGEESDEAKANAALISAAPDLLEALKGAVTQTVYRIDPAIKIEGIFSGLTKLPSNRVWPEWVVNATTAIAKATVQS